MPDNEDLRGKIRVLNFQGQTGFDADLKTQNEAYSPVASEQNERISYTISYADPTAMDVVADFDKFADGLPELMQQVAVEKLIKASK